LQDQTIERIGGRKPLAVDTRVIAATNVDLEKAKKEGGFREDLFYRLAVVVIRLPALRERKEDVVLLANAFLKKFSRENRRDKLKFLPGAIRALEQHDWAGNVRELENRIRRAVIMAEGSKVAAADLELGPAGDESGKLVTLKEARENLEREMILAALRSHQGKISPAAADLGISRPTFYELMDKLGLQKEKTNEPSGEAQP